MLRKIVFVTLMLSAALAAIPVNADSSAEFAVLALPADLVQSLSAGADALAKDDLAGYQKVLPDILAATEQTTGAVRATLLPLSRQLQPGKKIPSSLQTARKGFEPFSNAAANFVAAQPPDKRQAKVFECPMSPVLTLGRWIQKDNPKLLNPFFGSQMLTCGKEVK
ncbi:MAG: hypothetical protein LBT89_02185 [Planctomycetaceae bacterium]|jgi:Cu(I)/Ag(I) efflux system membrane fusion protein|nr:hypothetical protein [Planctomycetaceae bacterium]